MRGGGSAFARLHRTRTTQTTLHALARTPRSHPTPTHTHTHTRTRTPTHSTQRSWDRWILEGDLTVQQVLDWFDAKGLRAYSISCGQSLLYNDIFPKHKERLGKKMSELVVSVAKQALPAEGEGGRRHFDVVVAVEDEEGEDLDVPLVSIKFR